MHSRRGSRMLLALAGALLAALAPAGATAAAVGSDNYQDAPALLFSIPGSVGSTELYTTQGAAEPVATADCPAMFHTAWWLFTGTGRQINLTTAGSDFDTTLAVYDHGGGAPLAGNRKACAEAGGGGVLAALSFLSVRGRQYLVQAGGRLSSEFGRLALAASSPDRPANDDRAGARELQTGVAAVVSNAGASQEPNETLACGSASFAATIWFKWRTSAVGDAVVTSSGAFGDTVATVYRAADGAIVGCDANSTATVRVRLDPGDYLIQVGTKGSDVAGLGVGDITTTARFTVDPDLDNDGEFASTDCNDADPGIRHGIVDIPGDGIDQDCSGADAPILDRDRDGENRPSDCDDSNPAIHHGARDIPGNAVDEDCTGGPAPFPKLESTVRASWRFKPFRITSLTILRSVARSRLELRCTGRGCGFKRTVVKITRSRAEFAVRNRKLTRSRPRRGAVIEVRITKPGYVGFVRRYTVRAGSKDPKIRDLCLPPTTKKPRACTP